MDQGRASISDRSGLGYPQSRLWVPQAERERFAVARRHPWGEGNAVWGNSAGDSGTQVVHHDCCVFQQADVDALLCDPLLDALTQRIVALHGNPAAQGLACHWAHLRPCGAIETRQQWNLLPQLYSIARDHCRRQCVIAYTV